LLAVRPANYGNHDPGNVCAVPHGRNAWYGAQLISINACVNSLEKALSRIRLHRQSTFSLLAQGPDRQLDRVREMADYITPRMGFTPHPLTIHAAGQMVHLVERACHFREVDVGTSATPAVPYKRTLVFDENTLPAGLRGEHRIKPGVWGIIRVLDGQLSYRILEPASEMILDASHPGLVLPEVAHVVEPLGPMRMQVEFYHQLPDLKGVTPTECGNDTRGAMTPV
jgi:tellurite resistance-related uncharacterized protein